MRNLIVASLFACVLSSSAAIGVRFDHEDASAKTVLMKHHRHVGAEKQQAPPSVRTANTNNKASSSSSSVFNDQFGNPLATIPTYPADYYNYMPIDDGYDSNFFYKIETIVPPTQRATAPLVLWLQGGPGASSLFGAYAETGAKLYKVDKSNPNNGYVFETNPNTWTKYSTMLYVDNPIGTGFSFTKDPKGFSTTDEGIAQNLVKFLRNFLIRHPEFVKNEFHIFCESYGGKMAAFFANALAKEVLDKKTFPPGFRLASVALGDGWVDPTECMVSYGPYLQALGQITEAQRVVTDKYATDAIAALGRNNGKEATNLWSSQQTFIGTATSGLNWYNSLTTFSYIPESELDAWLLKDFPTLPEVTKYVNITSTYSGQSDQVFANLQNAFMRDGIDQVVELLNRPASDNVKVAVYVGEVDLIVNPICTRTWVNKMDKWAGIDEFRGQPLKPFYSAAFPYPQQVLASRQTHGPLQVWNINTAGHMVPADTPIAAEVMFRSILGLDKAGADVPPVGAISAEQMMQREHQKKMNAKKVNPKKIVRP